MCPVRNSKDALADVLSKISVAAKAPKIVSRQIEEEAQSEEASEVRPIPLETPSEVIARGLKTNRSGEG